MIKSSEKQSGDIEYAGNNRQRLEEQRISHYRSISTTCGKMIRIYKNYSSVK